MGDTSDSVDPRPRIWLVFNRGTKKHLSVPFSSTISAMLYDIYLLFPGEYDGVVCTKPAARTMRVCEFVCCSCACVSLLLRKAVGRGYVIVK